MKAAKIQIKKYIRLLIYKKRIGQHRKFYYYTRKVGSPLR